MSDYIRPSVPRQAAKRHRCIYCGESVVEGTRYYEQTGYWDGKAFRNRFHIECFEDGLDGVGEEFIPYSQERPKFEEAERLG